MPASPPVSSPGRARRVGGVLAGLLVAAFLLWGVAGGWQEAAAYPWHVKVPDVVAAVLVLAGFYVAWAVGWVGLVERLAGRRLPRRHFASIWARSILGRYVPGNALMVAGRVVLGRDAGVPARVSAGASVYEQVTMLVAASLGAIAYLAVAGGGLSPGFLCVLVLPLGLVLLDPAVLGGAMRRLLRRLGREGLPPLLSRRAVAVVLAWFAGTMGLLAVGTALGVRAVAGSSAGGVADLALGFLLAWAVSMAAFVFPSGLGLREGAFAVVLGRHLPTPAAVSLAAASRLLVTAVELTVVGVLVWAGRQGAENSRATGAVLGEGLDAGPPV